MSAISPASKHARGSLALQRDRSADAVVPYELIACALVAMAGEEDLKLRARGTCMEPSIGDGEELTLSAVRLPWPGDIVAALDELGRIRVHRLLGYRPCWRGGRPFLALVTRADNVRAIDTPVPLARLIGRVERIGERRPTIQVDDRLKAIAAFLRGAAGWFCRRLRQQPA